MWSRIGRIVNFTCHVLWAILGLAALLALCLNPGCASVAHAQTEQVDWRPSRSSDLILFSVPGCSSCRTAAAYLNSAGISYRKLELTASGDNPVEWNEFLTAVPSTSIDPPADYVGPARARTRTATMPILWLRGRDNYWWGWSSSRGAEAVRYLTGQDVQPLPKPQRRLRAPEPRTWGVESLAGIEPDAQPEDFDGVEVIVAIGNLFEGHESARIAAVEKAEAALQSLARSEIGARVKATVIAQVAEPETFDRLAIAAGIRPGAGDYPRAAVHVLIPRRVEGLQQFIVSKVEKTLDEHYLPDLQSAGINLLFERLHGEVVAQLSAIANDPRRDALRRQRSSEFPPFSLVQYCLGAFIGERSKIGRRLLQRFGVAKA